MAYNDDIMYSIVESIGVITTYATGWSKEVNLVSWNGATPKIDIRDWSADHDRMSRGITLHADTEAKALAELLHNYFDIKDIKEEIDEG